ncbi:hypothetical protein KQX54_011764 [Cotesia glomerata]|uniref:Uncharacterized protein n=1 Tax=Cotesia glomerata TaxID=32391 RepID=A0AAV7J7J7_COTGL|nr:hypothetical protein KQX54_011764 [Cotesia glomerata]
MDLHSIGRDICSCKQRKSVCTNTRIPTQEDFSLKSILVYGNKAVEFVFNLRASHKPTRHRSWRTLGFTEKKLLTSSAGVAGRFDSFVHVIEDS